MRTHSDKSFVHWSLVQDRNAEYEFISSMEGYNSDPSSAPYKKSVMIFPEKVSPLADSNLLRS